MNLKQGREGKQKGREGGREVGKEGGRKKENTSLMEVFGMLN